MPGRWGCQWSFLSLLSLNSPLPEGEGWGEDVPALAVSFACVFPLSLRERELSRNLFHGERELRSAGPQVWHHLVSEQPHGPHHLIRCQVAPGKYGAEVVDARFVYGPLYLFPHRCRRPGYDDFPRLQVVEVANEIQKIVTGLFPQEVDVVEPGLEGFPALAPGLLVGVGDVNVADESQLGNCDVAVQPVDIRSAFQTCLYRS